jgi:hypothetical protein
MDWNTGICDSFTPNEPRMEMEIAEMEIAASRDS